MENHYLDAEAEAFRSRHLDSGDSARSGTMVSSVITSSLQSRPVCHRSLVFCSHNEGGGP